MAKAPSSASKRAEELRQKIRYYSRTYYLVEDPTAAPEISDEAFDRLVKELKELEAKYPELLYKDSPTQKIGDMLEGLASSLFASVEHVVPMMSLDNAFKPEEVNAWLARVQKAEVKSSYVCELKFDGMAVSILYENGRLRRSATRGNGKVGEDITENVPKIKDMRRQLKGDYPELLEVRGEIYLPISEFERLNDFRQKQNLRRYANPRNTAAGTLRQKDPAGVVVRELAWWCYQLVSIKGVGVKTKKLHSFSSHSESLKYLESLGLPINPEKQVMSSGEEIMAYLEKMEVGRHNYDYEVDGVVIKLDSLKAQESVGSTSHHPRWAIAYKFPPEEKITKLKNIHISIGSKGKVTPFADLEPVFVGGSTVRVATLHNQDQVGEKDVRPGDMVIVRKAGDVIPEVVGPVLEARPKNSQEWIFPDICPCDLQTELKRDEGEAAHYCPSPDCPFQQVGRIEHFASRGSMDIEGLAEGWVQAFVEKGLLVDVADIYSLDFPNLGHFNVAHDLGEFRVERILASINATKERPLFELIGALGIGSLKDISTNNSARNRAQKLASHFGKKFFSASEAELASILFEIEPKKSLAKQRARRIREFLDDPLNIKMLSELSVAGVKHIPKNLVLKSPKDPRNPKDLSVTTQAKLQKQLMNFKVAGLGNETARGIVEAGLLKCLADIYSLEKSQLLKLQTIRLYGKKNAAKLEASVKKSKKQPLDRLLFGLNIPHVGAVSGQLLADSFGSLDLIMKASRERLEAIDGVGEVQAKSVYEFMRNPKKLNIIKKLKKAGVNTVQPQAASQSGALAGQSFVITGTFSDMKREEVQQAIRDNGGKVLTGVSSKADYVVAGEKPGDAKIKRAKDLGLSILSERQFLDRLNDKTAVVPTLF